MRRLSVRPDISGGQSVIFSAMSRSIRRDGQDVTLHRPFPETQQIGGWIWPTRSSLISPLAYLRRRLDGIDWTGESPSEQRKSADLARKREQELLESSHVQRTKMAANPEHRAKILASIRAHLTCKQQH